MLTNIKKITAENTGLTTYTGTNSYIIGNENLIVIDPGPPSDKHLSSIIRYIGKRKVEFIIATHHHSDHIGLLYKLSIETNAPIYIGKNQVSLFLEYEQRLKDKISLFDSIISTNELSMNAIQTPGHASDHYCFQIPGVAMFTGDHIMGWSTTMIRLPDGNMKDYMESLKIIRNLCNEEFFPAHGEKIIDGKKRCEQLINHRNKRSTQIQNTLQLTKLNLEEITKIINKKINTKLITYAKFTVESSLEEMVANKLIKKEKIRDTYFYSLKES